MLNAGRNTIREVEELIELSQHVLLHFYRRTRNTKSCQNGCVHAISCCPATGRYSYLIENMSVPADRGRDKAWFYASRIKSDPQKVIRNQPSVTRIGNYR